MTATLTRPETVVEEQLELVSQRSRGLWVALAILAIAVLGLGTWIVVDMFRSSEVTPSGEIASLLDDYTAAWNEYDGDAMLELTTPGFTFTAAGGMKLDRADTATHVANELPAHRFSMERPGFPVMMGDGPWYVAMPVHTTTNIREADGIAILTIMNQGDTYLVVRHTVTGDF